MSDLSNARLLTTEELIAANPWLKKSTLAYFAWAGGGPPFYKRGRRRLYDPLEFDAWLRENRKTHTSDSGASNA